MSEEKKTFELKDEQLEKVTGGFTYEGQLPCTIEESGVYIIGSRKIMIKDIIGRVEGSDSLFTCRYQVLQDFSGAPYPSGDIEDDLPLEYMQKVN